jgi:hypothetical protein
MKKTIKKLLCKLSGLIFGQLLLNQKKLLISQIISNALTKGSIASASRVIDSSKPNTWEFSAFSQNCEDGIIDYLTRKITNPNKYFIEIGASTGIECNSAYLAYVQKFSGLMIDGSKTAIEQAKSIVHSLGVSYHSQFVTLANIKDIKQLSLYSNPDLFSWDTDGNDYYFVKELFAVGFRPKIIVVEYNSAFGPDKKITIEYAADFYINTAHETALYYGCSIALWRTLFEEKNYTFVTVDSNGVNAFFIDNSQFDVDFSNAINGKDFVENFYQFNKFRCTWENQFKLIQDMPFYTID